MRGHAHCGCGASECSGERPAGALKGASKRASARATAGAGWTIERMDSFVRVGGMTRGADYARVQTGCGAKPHPCFAGAFPRATASAAAKPTRLPPGEGGKRRKGGGYCKGELANTSEGWSEVARFWWTRMELSHSLLFHCRLT